MGILHKLVCSSVVAFALTFAGIDCALAQLKVSYGSAGVETLSYAGVVLEDRASSPADTFHIWHMKLSDLSGNTLSGPNYGWGENAQSKVWNASTATWTYQFVWGSVSVQFVQQPNFSGHGCD